MFLIDKQNIGSVIKKARKKAKLKQYQLAEMAGFTDKHLSRIENGKYLPKLEHFLILSAILHLELSDFEIIQNTKKFSDEKKSLIDKIILLDSEKLKLYENILNLVEETIAFN